MGAKAGLVHLGEGPPVDALRSFPAPDPDRSAELAATVLGEPVRPAGTRSLAEGGVWPEGGTICTAAYEHSALIGYRELCPDRPSDITQWINAVSPTGGACGVFMHSVVDFAAFAVWEHGEIRRSISLAPDSGIIEDLGEPLPFEEPFRAGHHALDDYPLAFHPLHFGETALQALFGFGIESHPRDFAFDPHDLALPAFRPGPHAMVADR